VNWRELDSQQKNVALPLFLQGHFVGQGKVVIFRIFPVNQMHIFMRLSCGIRTLAG
jgi:hypothetical protein